MIPLEISFDISNIDDLGITIAVVGYTVVFAALVLLFFVFSNIPKIIKMNIRRKLRKEGNDDCAEMEDLDVSGEVNAAISTALYLYFNEYHDEESDIITIKQVSKRYSPWSSKIYGLKNLNKSY